MDSKKHGIKLPYLTYPDITKPIWIEYVYSNDKLYRLCKQEIKFAENSLNAILECIEWRKDPKLCSKVKNIPNRF